MTAFVLVHGAWGGSYGWRKVRPLLQAAGHDVFTPPIRAWVSAHTWRRRR
jgi:hypothetical protein